MTFKTIHEAIHALDPIGRPLLPEYTLGWQALKNANDDGFELDELEKRTLMWAYAVNELGEPLFDECMPEVVQRVDATRGHLVFGGWAARDMPEIGVAYGEPIGRPEDER